MVNVDEYTSPMDPMGNGLISPRNSFYRFVAGVISPSSFRAVMGTSLTRGHTKS